MYLSYVSKLCISAMYLSYVSKLRIYVLMYLCICVSMHLSHSLSLSLFFSSSLCLSIDQSTKPSIYLPVHLYITYLRLIYLPTYLRTSLSLYISISLSLYLSVYLSIYPSIYLSIYLYFLYRLSNPSQPLMFCHPIYLYLVFLLCIRVLIKIRRTYLCIFM